MKTDNLRKIRIILAAIMSAGITLMFMDFTGALHKWLGWMAKIQFLPALLAVNTVIIAGLLLLTILFGRIYCSVICPLGIMQDIISWCNGKLKKKNKFRYRKEKKWLRLGVLAIFIATLALGSHSLAAIIAPYSAYGRIASNLFAPIYQWGNNLLAWASERVGSYVMSFILGNHTIDEILQAVSTSFDGSEFYYSVDQLQNASIAIKSDPREITDKKGNIVRRIYTSKNGEFNATNAFLHPALMNAASGSDIEKASSTNKIYMPKIEIVAPGTVIDDDTTDFSDAKVVGIYGNGANSEPLTVSTSTASIATMIVTLVNLLK